MLHDAGSNILKIVPKPARHTRCEPTGEDPIFALLKLHSADEKAQNAAIIGFDGGVVTG